MAMNTSFRYDHITSKVLIQSGSPAVYQLKPKKENIGTLTKMTLGEKNPKKTNKTILLVGETGSGKSTLINALVNYTMGVKWEDDVWFQMVDDKEKEDEEERSQTETQTTDVMVYQIFGFEGKTLPYSLTIIDTPGYGDTRGIEKDDIIRERLLDLFRSKGGVHQINAVGLVMKASENRLSDRLSYIFDSVVSLFGKNMEENIVALITHSDGVTPKNALKALEVANIKCARTEKNQPIYFLFNNMQNEDRTKNTGALQYFEKLTTEGLRQFTDFLEKTAPQKLTTTVEVLTERVRLTACIQNLQERIKSTELQQKEIQQTQEALKKHEEEMKNNEKFTVEVDEVYKVEKDKSERRFWALWLNYGGAVRCTNCKENCHHPCTLAWYAEHCEVIKDGHCTSCTGKCPVSDHVKDKKIYVSETKKVQMTKEDMKQKYEDSKTDGEQTTNLLENLKKKIKDLQKEQAELLEESFQHVVKLDQIALNVNSLSTYVHLDFLTEKMKEKGDTEKVQKLEEMKSRLSKDKGFGAGLQYKLTAAGKAVMKN